MRVITVPPLAEQVTEDLPDEEPTYADLEHTLSVIRRKLAEKDEEIKRLTSVLASERASRRECAADAAMHLIHELKYRMGEYIHDEYGVDIE